MILGSKYVGAILNALYKQFYVCALVGVLIKRLYEMHGATIKKAPWRFIFFFVLIGQISGTVFWKREAKSSYKSFHNI